MASKWLIPSYLEDLDGRKEEVRPVESRKSSVDEPSFRIAIRCVRCGALEITV